MRIDVRVQNHFVKNTSKKTALKQNTFVRVFNHGFSDKTTQNVQKTIEKHRKSFWFTVSFYKTAFSYCLDGGQRWIRTTEVWDVRFTVWSIWPLWNLSVWCLEVESNHRQRDFQSLALPTELSRQKWRPKRGSNSWPPAWQAGALTKLSYWALPFKAHQRMLDYNNLFSHICQAFFSFFAQIFKKFSEHFSRRFLSFLSV